MVWAKDPKGQMWLQNIFAATDKTTTRYLGTHDTSHTDPLGNETTYTLDVNDRVVETITHETVTYLDPDQTAGGPFEAREVRKGVEDGLDSSPGET